MTLGADLQGDFSSGGLCTQWAFSVEVYTLMSPASQMNSANQTT